MSIGNMRYKWFTWEYNPGRCMYTCDKAIVSHKYPELRGIELEDFDINAAVISGVGEFFGRNAYRQWQELNRVFRDRGPGEFFHPIFTDVTQAILRKLDATMEPRENYVSYTFEFIQHLPPVAVISITPPEYLIENPRMESSKTLGTLKNGHMGDWVVKLQKELINNGISLPRYGADGYYGAETEAGVRKFQSENGLTIDGIAGPDTLSKLGLEYYGGAKTYKNSKTSKDTDIYHTIKQGESLLSIANIYDVDWREIAKLNGIKNPHQIRVMIGDRLLIPNVGQSTITMNVGGR